MYKNILDTKDTTLQYYTKVIIKSGTKVTLYVEEFCVASKIFICLFDAFLYVLFTSWLLRGELKIKKSSFTGSRLKLMGK